MSERKGASLIICCLLFFVALIFRSINFGETLNFAGDQGEFLIESAKILNGEPVKLIGIYVSSKPVENKYFFIGSQFSYFLAFWQKLFSYDPLAITYVFVILNSLSVVWIFLICRKFFGQNNALVAGLFYATNFFAINYSKIIWNPTLQPFLISLLLLILLVPRRWLIARMFWIGIILGLLIAIEYASLILLPIIGIMAFSYLRRNTKPIFLPLVVLLVGLGAGLINLIVFDLRHNFYNSTLLFKFYFSATTKANGLGLDSHHLLTLLPFLFLVGCLVYAKTKRWKLTNIVILIMFVIQMYITLTFIMKTENGFRMAKGVHYEDLDMAAKIIARDSPERFNIAQLIDGNTRANALRYLLIYEHNMAKSLLPYDKYGESDYLYVFHYPGQKITVGGPYELVSFSEKRKRVKSWKINDRLVLTKLINND